jgi:hypothetical protein
MAGNLHVTWHDRADGTVEQRDVVLIEDATAVWKKSDGYFDLETVQKVDIESLREFARIATTDEVLKELESERAVENNS